MEKKNRISKLALGSYFILCTFTFSACKKFLEVGTPSTKTSTESAYNDNTTATAVITGIYTQMSDNYINNLTLAATSFYEELSADNLVVYDISLRTDLASYYQNNLEPNYTYTGNQTYWATTFKLVYTLNTSIDALSNNIVLSATVSKRLLGEAYFLRAFCYFYLVNFYGEVPLVLKGDYTLNSKMARNPITDIYNQIISDLSKAENLLDNNYVGSDVSQITLERLRPNLAAVNALQARVYLYLKDYSAAENSASKVINQSQYSFTDLNSVFLRNSSETIWALQPVNNGYNTREGQIYKLPSDGPNYDHAVYASDSLINSFEAGDGRMNAWMGKVIVGSKIYFYPYKYKLPFVDGSTTAKEYTIVLRLAEQYLIRAEARAQMGNLIGAAEDLNSIRNRSGLSNSSASTSSELMTAILRERRVELFTEWGHRWFDLKRSGNIDVIMEGAEKYKGGDWSNYKALYPIPVSDILIDASLTQNPGYTH